jgi:hypothetical protein
VLAVEFVPGERALAIASITSNERVKWPTPKSCAPAMAWPVGRASIAIGPRRDDEAANTSTPPRPRRQPFEGPRAPRAQARPPSKSDSQ